MNIVTPLPTQFALPTANIATEAARRDNLLRESIPANAEADKNRTQQGVGSDAEQARASVQKQVAATYDKPFNNIVADPQAASAQTGEKNPDQQSAGRENTEQRQQQQAREAKVEALKQRDTEVRTHEQAHAVAGGKYAGAPSYEYTTGPDNRRYVTDGEVSIDVSKAATAQQTIEKMSQVRRAALAPAEPSAQDRKVAAQAAVTQQQARNELASAESPNQTPTDFKGTQTEQNTPTDNDGLFSAGLLQAGAYDKLTMQARMLRIQQVYDSNAQAPDPGFAARA